MEKSYISDDVYDNLHTVYLKAYIISKQIICEVYFVAEDFLIKVGRSLLLFGSGDKFTFLTLKYCFVWLKQRAGAI